MASATENWAAIKEKVSKKAIIYTIMDQDATYKNYIGPHWPEIRVFYNANQFWCFAYPWKRVVPKSQQPYLESSFMGANIINNHGPLFEKYYSYGDLLLVNADLSFFPMFKGKNNGPISGKLLLGLPIIGLLAVPRSTTASLAFSVLSLGRYP